MKEFVFDWNIFKNKGFEFQDMCADIFRQYQYNVRVLEKGGSDNGRDIIIYKETPHELIEFDDTPYAWVECKSQIQGSPINLTKINTNFLYVFKEDISYLIFITNHKFNNEAHNLFVEYNKCNLPFKIRYIEREELESILKNIPSVYVKYFDKKGKLDDYKNDALVQDESIKYRLTTNSSFIDEYEELQVELRNLGFTNKKCNINVVDNISINVELEPFERKTLSIAQDILNLPQEIKLNYKIDHLYVDPFNMKDKVMRSLDNYNNIYINGSAGTGKSRLLYEVSKKLNVKPIIIDISTDYSESFIEQLLSKMFGIEIAYLKLLPDDIIKSHLLNGLISDENTVQLFVAFIKGRLRDLNYEVILNETSELFVKKYQKQIVFIDNIHRFSVLDFKLLQKMIEINDNNYLIFTARENEIIENSLSIYLKKQIEENNISQINLSKISINKLIVSFIDIACGNDNTKSFLKTYQTAENFQQFIFTLKTLRLKKIISQDSQGKIIVCDTSQNLKKTDYVELYKDLIKYFETSLPNKNASEILKLGATYGYNFPVDLIENYFGDEALDTLDDLLLQEFLKENTTELSGNIFINFDHELTREIIYNAILPIQKKKLHKFIINYIEELGETSSLYSYSQLAFHYENIYNPSKAAFFTNKEGHKQQQKSQLETAYKYFDSSLKFIEQTQKNNVGDLYDIEADSLNQMINLQFNLSGIKGIHGKIRSLEVLSLLLNNDYYKGIASYYFSKYYFDKNDRKNALSKINISINLLQKEQYQIEFGNAVNFKGVILKNNCDFESAKELHQKAIKIFEDLKHWAGVSEALADLGAVFLESGKGDQVSKYWEESLNSAKRTHNSIEICNRLIDFSYILALYNDQRYETGNEMENAIFMASKLNLKPNLCRTKLNYSNYLFFSTNAAIDIIYQLITSAIILCEELEDYYLILLCKFSYYTFKKKNNEFFLTDYSLDIINLIRTFNIDDFKKGDVRIINILKTFLVEDVKDIVEFVHSNSIMELTDFLNQLESKNINEIESNNPYFRNGLYATYY